MRVIFCFKVFEILSKYQNCKKEAEKVFCVLHNSSALIALKLSLFKREYLSSAINVLTKCPKIFHITKTEFFQLKFLPIDQKL